MEKISLICKKALSNFRSLDKRVRIVVISACVVAIATLGFLATTTTTSGPTGTWYTNGVMKAVTQNPDKSADINYLTDPDSPNLHHVVLADSATWEQDGDEVKIHYKEEHKSSSKSEYTIYLIYGKDSTGDEFLKNLRTGDVMYRTGSICESKNL